MRPALLLLVPLLALPWLAAAPVPKAVPDFTHSCTAEMLAKLPFVDADPKRRKDESSETLAAKSISVAVHLARDTFEEGDPVPALFVVKNRADKPHGLWMELDFGRKYAGGAGHIEVRNAATGAISSPFLGHSTMCGGAHWAIPAGGYWAVWGNVGVSGAGERLPAGDYELSWEYAGTRSKAAKFTVVARRLGRPEPTPVRSLSVLRVAENEDEDKKSAVSPMTGGELPHALSTGEFGAFHPDIRALPPEAGGLRAVAAWNGDNLAVTLDSPNKEFDTLASREPVVFLLVEHSGASEDFRAKEREKLKDAKQAAGERGKLPRKLEFELHTGWKDKTGLTGECRVAVVVASREPPERTYGSERLVESVKVAEEKAAGNGVRKTKPGDWVLRTEWQLVTFPKVAAKPKADE